MDQNSYNEINKLEDNLSKIQQTWIEENNKILLSVAEGNYTEKTKDIIASYDKMKKEGEEVGNKLNEILKNCDHQYPDKESAFCWTPCDTIRCAFCGLSEDEFRSQIRS